MAVEENNPFPTLETDRLILRQVTPDDADALYHYLQDFEVTKNLGSEPYTSIEQVHTTIEWYDYSFQEEMGLRLGVCLKETGQLIGTCGLHSWEPDDYRAEVVSVLGKEFWGQGLMTEALRAVIDYSFEELGLYRLQAKIEPQNLASRRLYEKLGFREEGLLRGYVYVYGEHRDNIMYGLLKHEWEK